MGWLFLLESTCHKVIRWKGLSFCEAQLLINIKNQLWLIGGKGLHINQSAV
jgi:hypothetical protein